MRVIDNRTVIVDDDAPSRFKTVGEAETLIDVANSDGAMSGGTSV